MKRLYTQRIYRRATAFIGCLMSFCMAGAQGVTYAPHSLMATGKWVKITVPQTGFYELSDSLITAAGFDDVSKVRLYGYGGAIQPETLNAAYLTNTDDMPQVPLCMTGGRRVFHAIGPVGWDTPTTLTRQRNPYSQYGAYFLADVGDEPLIMDSEAFEHAYYPTPDDYHALYEVDDFSWYHGGRNLFDSRTFGTDVERTYALPSHQSNGATLSVVMSYKNYCEASVAVNGNIVGYITVNAQTTKQPGGKAKPGGYNKAAVDTWTFATEATNADSIRVTIRQLSGSEMRLDYLQLTFSEPRPLAELATAPLPQPSIAGETENQDLHAHGPADMIIIIPQSGLLAEQAERLAQMHRQHDSLSTRVVNAGMLYNEFSSGTPDVAAYRRYMKMLYDRAGSNTADKPKYLLLMGGSAFDNRMISSNFHQRNTTDYLLCYESDNSTSETECYVTDDFFTMLDEGEGNDILKYDKSDVAVGRLPAVTPEDAEIMVDKAECYRLRTTAGAWQNVVCFMGDDGNANLHMNDADTVAKRVQAMWPFMNVKKVYWDAYQRVTTSNGNTYPDATNLIRQQMRDGALLMNYSGHGNASSFSHEHVVDISDFSISSSLRLPVWFTASCDVAPFDGHGTYIAQQAMLNPQGGAIAFIGTTRTVYASHNRSLNKAFMQHLFSYDESGQPMPIGEALRRAKNDQVKGSATAKQAGINRLHFTLLGDPALRLPLPTAHAVIDSINGIPANEETILLIAGDSATVAGHVEGYSDFCGLASLTLKDAQQTITCRMNPLAADEMPKKPLVFTDRPTTLFVGNDSVKNAKFRFTFAVPKDISYSDDPGQILVYAINDQRTVFANGGNTNFVMGSADDYEVLNHEGPVITAWLENSNFRNGDATSSVTPLFHADMYDEDGINAAGCGIGHDIEIVIDGQMARTYNLNSYFNYDFSQYRSGYVDYVLPALTEGSHELLFRVWDMLNNSSTVTLQFTVGMGAVRAAIEQQSATGINMQTYIADITGRAVTNHATGILIYRTPDGKVKKMVRRRQ